MLVISTNRQINGKTVLVTDPQTGQFLNPSEPIDLDTVDFEKKLFYLRALEQGDLQEYTDNTHGGE